MLSPYTQKFFLSALILFMCFTAHAAWNFSQTSVTINANGNSVARAGGYNSLGQPTYSNIYLGNFNSASTLVLTSAMVHSAMTAPSNVCAASLQYRLYRSSDPTPAWISVNLTNATSLGSGVVQWDNNNININLLSGLSSATYYLEIRWILNGHATCNNCCTQQLYDLSATQGYRAYLDYDLTDSFTDLDFTSNPAWSGETASFRVANNTIASTGGTNSRSIRLRAPNVAGTQHIRFSNSVWSPTEQHWSFWLGNRTNAFDNNNNVAIWLYANEANLESNTVDGYRIYIGDNTGGDEIFLQSVTNGVGTNIITSAAIPNGLTDIGIAIRVQRMAGGTWTLFTSVLPSANSMGPTALTSPVNVATVNQGTAINNAYTPNGLGYCGIVCTHGSSMNERRNFEFDAFRLYSVFASTAVQFVSTYTIKNETDGSVNIPLSITNPSPTVATTATISLTSGSAARVSGFASQNVVFPAGSSAIQYLSINITDNSLCDDEANLVFSITNVTGGNMAAANNPVNHSLRIIDDNMDYKTIANVDFENANLSAWNQSATNAWYADNSEPISNSYSMRHTDTGTNGQSYATINMGAHSFDGVATVWSFNMNHFETEPDHQDKFLVFLTANEQNLFSNTVDGYAVGVNAANGSAPDWITLWQITNGAPTSAIVTSAVDWNSTHSEIGLEVKRTESGVWELRISENGGFENLVLAGSGTNTVYPAMPYFGLRYVFKNSTSGKLALDDVNIIQKGCRVTYYSQTSGNVNGPIWATAPVGPSAVASPGRLNSFVVQNSHNVQLNVDWSMEDLTIQNTGTLSMNAQRLNIYDDVLINGNLSAGTSTLAFVGEVDQSFDHSALITLYNLEVNNSMHTVTLANNAFVNVQNMVYPESGTLQTNGRLCLVSTAAKTGAIGEIKPGADVLGNITLERYIPALTNYPHGSWVLMGCPLQGATLEDWNDDIITTGFTGSDYPPPYSFNNIQYYDESVAGDAGQGYVGASNITNALLSNKGYCVYMQTPSQLIDVSGAIYKNTFNTPLNYTSNANAADGWNLMVNQYPSMIDFQQLANASNGVASYYLYDAEMNNYKSYNAVADVGTATKYINSSQAFFVKAASPGSYLQYQESFKLNNNTPFERNEIFSSNFTFTIQSFNNTADQCIVHFDENATENFEWTHDAEKLFSLNEEAVNCALLSSDNIALTIDSRPYLQLETSIPVFAEFPLPGVYQFIINDVNNLPFGACLYVEDLVTGNTIPVAVGESMTIETSAPESGIRFIIHTTPALQVSISDATCSNTNDGQIMIAGNTQDWGIQLMGPNGVTITSTNNYQFTNMDAGDYEIQLTSFNENCISSNMFVSISQPNESYIDVVSSSPAWCNEANNASMELYISPELYEYSISNSAGETVAAGTSNQPELLFENMTADIYTITTTHSCGTNQIEVNLKDPMAITTNIIEDEISIMLSNGVAETVAIEQSTENATSWYWSLDDGTISSEQVFIHEFVLPGEYTLMLIAQNENCAAADFIHISVSENVAVTEHTPAAYFSMLQQDNALDFTLLQSKGGMIEIRLYDINGKLIIEQATPALEGQTTTVSTSALAPGIYTAIASLDKATLLSKKFFILKK